MAKGRGNREEREGKTKGKGERKQRGKGGNREE